MGLVAQSLVVVFAHAFGSVVGVVGIVTKVRKT
jgi:hypothetical protein